MLNKIIQGIHDALRIFFKPQNSFTQTLLFLVDPNQLMLKNSECMIGMLASALEPEAGILLAVRVGAPGSWLLTDSALNPCCSSYWPASFVSGWSGEHSIFPTASGVTELSRDCLTLILPNSKCPERTQLYPSSPFFTHNKSTPHPFCGLVSLQRGCGR